MPALRSSLVFLLLFRAAPADQLPTARLTIPNARLAEEFSDIRGARELADGRVLVSDYIDQRVVLVDFDRGTVTPRVGRGGGPAEARLPTRLVAIRGDSTLLVDLGNNRLLVLDGQGRPVRTIPAERPGMLGARGVDPTGALFYAVPSWAAQPPLPNDSVQIVRLSSRTGTAEPIAVIQGDRMRSDIRSPALKPRIPTVGFAAQDAWLVGSDGVVRIVRAGSYRVESLSSGGRLSPGPSYAYETRPVSADDRVSFVRRFLTSSPVSGKGEGGGLGHAPAPTESEILAMVPGTQFADRHPMFSAGDVVAAPGGQLWVGRPAENGKPARYDVFDASGRRVGSVELQPGRRVLAVGQRGVYVAAENEDGIQQLERYPLPR